ncbi:hypothetical protein [Mycoplasmoides alvi]|uniref:hypothetical protein n=1 Tax=Mycoplasmoides alvi TaxID=78580 RepID=UPI00051C7ECA|nr:hypothetical protein [Mycoplasmoides alvi]
MTKIDQKNKQKIFGGLSFWSFAMGSSLIFQTINNAITNLLNIFLHNNNSNTTYNNSWASNYNRYNPSSSIAIKYGLTPKQSSIMMI